MKVGMNGDDPTEGIQFMIVIIYYFQIYTLEPHRNTVFGSIV